VNPYLVIGSSVGTNEATSLSARLSAWHDAMVAHERRLGPRTSELCDDHCPHGEARALWFEAIELFGPRAHELTFLRSRGTMPHRVTSSDTAAFSDVVATAAEF
jgi:hypothetical protein